MPSPRVLLACLAIAGGFSTSSGWAATIRVKPDGSGDQPTIQAAVNAALPGDIVELEAGTFSGPGNRDITYGGKPITVRAKNGLASSTTIDCGGSSGEPHRAFWFGTGEGAGSVLEAVTIRNGRSWDQGGAILCQGASPTLRGLRILESQAGYGGGLACADGAGPTIDRCFFSGNRADFGSAAACRGSSPRFLDCRFEANEVAEIGGALLCEAASHPSIERCEFTNNDAEIGGGLACRDDSNPRVYRCTFLRNTALAGGGEAGGAWCANSSPLFEECVFAFNEASGHGGALVAVIAAPRLSRCTLIGNRAPKGAGVYSWLDSSPTIGGTIIAFSGEGEAVACEMGGSASLACCDLYGNAGGDWVGGIATQLAGASNFTADPRFCDAGSGDARLRSDSPCRTGQNPGATSCGVIGAIEAMCTDSGSADLMLRKRVDRPNVSQGGHVTYTITLFNLGPAMARNVVFGDPLPDPVNLVSFATSRGAILSNSYCGIDSIAPGDSVTATLVATPIANPAPSERYFQNTAYIDHCDTPDAVPGNNQSSVWVYISELPSDTQAEGALGGHVRLELASQEPGTTRFRFSLPAGDAKVDLSVFDVRGRHIATLAHGAFGAGEHVANWEQRPDERGFSSGVYYVRLRTARDAVSRKVHLVH